MSTFLLLAGKPLAFSSCPYATHFPHPGWAEQSPAEWWAALSTAVRDAVAKSGVATSSIAAISLDTTNCTVVALDKGMHSQVTWSGCHVDTAVRYWSERQQQAH
jgi:sugar (pentulose or hexulose) kinase